MWTKLHWVDGPWPGKLALASRPRGGDWLADEMVHWRQAGIDFIAFPILDRQVPESESAFTHTMCRIDAELAIGRNVVLHCRQGVGRTGLLAAGLLLAKGFEPDAAVNLLSRARGIPIPETPEQRRWLDGYANQFAVVR